MPRPRQFRVARLIGLCIKRIAKDNETVYDFDGILPVLAIQIFYSKCYHKMLKENQIVQLIKPGLTRLDLWWRSDLLPQILRAIGSTQRHLKDVTLVKGENIQLDKNVYKALAPALQQVNSLEINFGTKEIIYSLKVDLHY